MKTVKDFFAEKIEAVEKMSGRKGVIELREKLDILHKNYTDRQIIMNGQPVMKYIERIYCEKAVARALRRGKSLDLSKIEWVDHEEILRNVRIAAEYHKYKLLAIEAGKIPYVNISRGGYGQLFLSYEKKGEYFYVFTDEVLSKRLQIMNGYNSIIKDLERPDEHGWVTGGDWDKQGRGQQVSIDLYGIDFDRNLYVVQVRQSIRRAASYYLQTRKSYFLVGRNENGNAFAHCISSAAVHAAIKREPEDDVIPEIVVDGALQWIWCTDRYRDIIRHGDVALLPVKAVPKIAPIDENTIMVIDSHQLAADEIRRKNGVIYAKNPRLHHLKNQHPDVKTTEWARVIVGRRDSAWDFSPATVD
jgi:hypothetical protein